MKWTPEKIKALCERYPNEDNAALAKDLGCSRKALAYRASSLGIKKSEKAKEAHYLKLAANFGQKRSGIEGGTRREIGTGVVIVSGGTLTHLSHVSAGV